MSGAINGVSHNAPDNMATNSPNKPAVANNASFAMQYQYPFARCTTPELTNPVRRRLGAEDFAEAGAR